MKVELGGTERSLLRLISEFSMKERKISAYELGLETIGIC